MAGERPDESQKTEEPTQKRLQEAQQKGQVAKSQEVGHWFMILAFAIIVGFVAPGVVQGLGRALYGFVARPHTIPVDGSGLAGLLGELSARVGLALLLPVLLALAAAVAAGLIQTGFVFSAEPIKPKLEKISPASGLKRLFSARALVEFLKGVAKLAIVACVIALLLWPERRLIADLVAMDPPRFLALIHSLASRVLLAVLAVMTVIAGLDLLFQRHQHAKQMRMSKQEVKDEFKQSEGDPMVKARLRQVRMERARQRMMAAVPEADVVIANPTHFAVALVYEPGSLGAPKVTAKGVDSLALRMRELAEENDVPVIENPPLARALHGSVELDQEIPSEHYKAVAEIIGYVMRLKGKMPGQAAGSQGGLPRSRR
jgi:flagellar biosynthetic protein FlhB